jgi:hypothetical protein
MKRILCLGFFALLLLVVPVCTSGDTDQSGRIAGTTYTTFGWGFGVLPFVHVQAGERSTYSFLNGNYALDNLQLGTYQVIARKFLFTSQSFTVALTEDNPTAQVNFTLNWVGGGSNSDIMAAGLEYSAIDLYS